MLMIDLSLVNLGVSGVHGRSERGGRCILGLLDSDERCTRCKQHRLVGMEKIMHKPASLAVIVTASIISKRLRPLTRFVTVVEDLDGALDLARLGVLGIDGKEHRMSVECGCADPPIGPPPD